jgi:hypothetical protein
LSRLSLYKKHSLLGPGSVQEENQLESSFKSDQRRKDKEATRELVLARKPLTYVYSQQASAVDNQIVKDTTAVGRKLMEPPKAKPKRPQKVSPPKKPPKVIKKKTVTKNPSKKKHSTALPTKVTPEKVITEPPSHQPVPSGGVKAGGCRHCDLGELLSFTKAEAKWYMQPNRYLAGKHCKDCQKPVVDMEPKPRSKTLLFYCDQGIKGFDAPENDPMKAVLTCDLVLCQQCTDVRRIEVEKENTKRGGRRPSRNRS